MPDQSKLRCYGPEVARFLWTTVYICSTVHNRFSKICERNEMKFLNDQVWIKNHSPRIPAAIISKRYARCGLYKIHLIRHAAALVSAEVCVWVCTRRYYDQITTDCRRPRLTANAIKRHKPISCESSYAVFSYSIYGSTNRQITIPIINVTFNRPFFSLRNLQITTIPQKLFLRNCWLSTPRWLLVLVTQVYPTNDAMFGRNRPSCISSL